MDAWSTIPWNQTHFSHVITSKSAGRQCARPAEECYETNGYATLVVHSFDSQRLCLLVGGLPARADEWSKTYNLSGKPDLRVETSDANIRVTTWDQNTIEAKVITTRYKIGEDGIRIEEHQNGDSVEIDVHYPAPQLQDRMGQLIAWTSSSRCRAKAASTCAPAMARSTSQT